MTREGEIVIYNMINTNTNQHFAIRKEIVECAVDILLKRNRIFQTQIESCIKTLEPGFVDPRAEANTYAKGYFGDRLGFTHVPRREDKEYHEGYYQIPPNYSFPDDLNMLEKVALLPLLPVIDSIKKRYL
jgi:hypothetical protein